MNSSDTVQSGKSYNYAPITIIVGDDIKLTVTNDAGCMNTSSVINVTVNA